MQCRTVEQIHIPHQLPHYAGPKCLGRTPTPVLLSLAIRLLMHEIKQSPIEPLGLFHVQCNIWELLTDFLLSSQSSLVRQDVSLRYTRKTLFRSCTRTSRCNIPMSTLPPLGNLKLSCRSIHQTPKLGIRTSPTSNYVNSCSRNKPTNRSINLEPDPCFRPFSPRRRNFSRGHLSMFVFAKSISLGHYS
jgi:hypothetical protein